MENYHLVTSTLVTIKPITHQDKQTNKHKTSMTLTLFDFIFGSLAFYPTTPPGDVVQSNPSMESIRMWNDREGGSVRIHEMLYQPFGGDG